MTELNLVCFEFLECHLLPKITSTLSEILSVPVYLQKQNALLDDYFHQQRVQYDAAQILSDHESTEDVKKTVLITSVDLFVPIFTFVFGLAKLQGSTAIVSAHRLVNEYYGLPKNDDLLVERLIKEVIHELGHLLNLRHCINFQCVMASSNTADELDIKGHHYCAACLSKINV